MFLYYKNIILKMAASVSCFRSLYHNLAILEQPPNNTTVTMTKIRTLILLITRNIRSNQK